MTTIEERRQMFSERYQTGETPWDTGITPPEIEAIVAELPSGRAVDLGCGTGTNVRYLLQHGWTADGVDFVQQAIDAAQTKLADFPAEQWRVFCHDVTKLDALIEADKGLRPPYDMAVDIGCGHGLPVDGQPDYAAHVAALLRPGGVFMLYAHGPSPERSSGWTPDDVRRLFGETFEMTWQALSDDTSTGEPSGWYRLQRR